MKIIISLKGKHLESFLEQNKVIKEVIEALKEYKSYNIQVCSHDYAISCRQKGKNFLIDFIGNER